MNWQAVERGSESEFPAYPLERPDQHKHDKCQEKILFAKREMLAPLTYQDWDISGQVGKRDNEDPPEKAELPNHDWQTHDEKGKLSPIGCCSIRGPA